MTIIGITGGSGAGKSEVCRIWREQGAVILNCDEIYDDLCQNDHAMRNELEERFPGATCKGGIDRTYLRSVVFADGEALSDLNRITHKHVLAELDRRLARLRQTGQAIAVVEAIYLIESGIGDMCGVTVAVCAPASLRIERIVRRDGISREAAAARIRAQREDGFYQSQCCHTILNNGDPAALQQAVLPLYQSFQKEAHNP